MLALLDFVTCLSLKSYFISTLYKMRIFRSLQLLLSVFRFASAATFTNPLKTPNGSDPHIVYTEGYYYLTTTTWDNIQLTRAKTLGSLKNGETKIVWKDSNSSRCCNIWAPELHWIDNVYVEWSPSVDSVSGILMFDFHISNNNAAR